ncbi:MAG: MFS transporter [Chloroflexota bacterium]|nr:MFS transporter [Chloroflexota bacterium]
MRLRILVLALGTFALGTDNFVIAGILPAIAQTLAVSVAVSGLLVTVFSLTYVVASPLLATLTGAVDRKRLLIVSLLLFVVANVLAALAPNFGVLLVARVIAACGAALYTPTASAVAAMLASPEKRGQALALVTAGMTVSIVLGVPIGILVGTHFGWQMTFVLVAVLGALATIGIMGLLPVVAGPPPASLGARLALLRKPSIVVALGLTVIWMVGGFTVYTYIAPILQGITHLGGAAISSLLFLFGVASVLGNMLGGYAADRWGPVPTIALGLAALAITLLVFPAVAVTVVGAGVALAIWGVAGWMLTPPQQHRLLALAPAAPGVILSLNGSASYLGIAGGAAIGSLVLHYAPLFTLGWVGGTCEVIALVVLLLGVRGAHSRDERAAVVTELANEVTHQTIGR